MNRLYELARATLDVVVAQWTIDPDVAAPLPAIRYVAFGQAVWDCEQFVVSGTRSYTIDGDPALEQNIGGWAFFNRAVELQLSIIRCVPGLDDEGNAPTGADIEASAVTAFADEQQLRDVLIDSQQARSLAAPQGLAFGNWVAQGPEGGLGGGMLTVRLAGF